MGAWRRETSGSSRAGARPGAAERVAADSDVEGFACGWPEESEGDAAVDRSCEERLECGHRGRRDVDALHLHEAARHSSEKDEREVIIIDAINS